mgnify:CR=1 FL=1
MSNDKAMPETIAVWRFIPEKPTEWIFGGWSEDHDHKTKSYTRTDLFNAATARAEAAEAEAARLREALEVMRGAFDTPISRRRINGDFATEARQLARAALSTDAGQ